MASSVQDSQSRGGKRLGAALLLILAASLADSRVALSQCHVTAQAEFWLYSRLPHLPAGSGSLLPCPARPGHTSSWGRAVGGQGAWRVKGRPAREWATFARATLPLRSRHNGGRALERVARCGRDSRGEAKGGTGDRGK